MIKEETFLAYQEQAEGLIKDQQRLIEEQKKTIEELEQCLRITVQVVEEIKREKLN